MLTSPRALWRSARSLPVLNRILLTVDRFWWARVIRHADIVDTAYVGLQLGSSVSARDAIRTYVHGGFRSGLSLNPLFSERLVSGQLPDADRVPALYAYLRTEPERIETSLSWDAPAYGLARAPSARSDGGPLGLAWRVLREGGMIGLRGGRLADLDTLHAAAANVLTRGPADAAPLLPEPHLVLLWELDADDADGTGLQAPLALLSSAPTLDPESRRPCNAQLVLLIEGAPRDVRLMAGQLALGDARIRTLEGAGRSTEEGHAPGTVLVRRDPGAIIEKKSLLRLAVQRDGPSAPVWLAPDGSISSAGLLPRQGHLYRALAGHPREDVLALGQEIRVVALDAPVRARVIGRHGEPTTLLQEAVMGEHSNAVPLPGAAWDERPDLPPPLPRGFTVDQAGSSVSAPRYRRTPETFPLPDGTEVPRLRWAIKTAAPAGRSGESWGETHFARALSDALERIGQYVAIDAHPALARTTSSLDDVVLALRGPRPLPVPPAARTILWIISHPDEITAPEAAGYDLVYAASAPWAAQASTAFDIPVRTLLQCTDARRFRPSGRTRGDELVFVGTARGIPRPSVIEPLRAGRPVRVYGPDWRGYIPGSAIVATHVPNDRLPALYESAGAVLNDHWPAMREEGFISNRLFDVVAAGGRAISDEVANIAELFGGAVRTYSDVPGLLELTAAPLDSHFGDAPEIAAVSARIRADHSFDARARALLDDVLRDGPADLLR